MDISGPAFLLVYAIVAIAVIVGARMLVRGADPSDAASPQPVSLDSDPYEVAYLRGGGNELLRYAIFDLTLEGKIDLVDAPTGKGKCMQAAPGAATGQESSLQSAVLSFLATPQSSRDLFKSQLPATAVAYGAATYDSALIGRQLIATPAMRASANQIRMISVLVLVALAGFRVANALLHGRFNFGFLIIEAAIALFVLVRVTRTGRLSRRGISFLARLRTAIGPSVAAPAAAPVAAGIGVLPILVAATGFGALAGTQYSPLGGAFPRSAAANSHTYTNCSSGCGTLVGSSSSSSDSSSSSCSGGSSCGGGCGG